MTRNLKALGLALVAVFAMSAMAASTASAQEVQDLFTSDLEKTIVTGTSHDHNFEITDATSFQCTTSRFASTVLDGANDMTIEATYTGTTNVVNHTTHCSSGVGAVTVDMNSCDYTLTGKTDGDYGPEVNKHAQVHIVCTKVGDHIVITSGLCTVRVPAHTPTEGGVTFTNEAGGKVKLKVTVTGITYTAHGGFCGLGGIPTHGNNAHYTGTILATGYRDDSGTKHPFTEGPVTNIEVSS